MIRRWWDKLNIIGPDYGYIPQPPKTWLLVKENALGKARLFFDSTGINISTNGRRLLGAAPGTQSFVKEYIENKVEVWTEEIVTLSRIAAFAAFTHGLKGRLTFTARCIDGLARHLEPLEAAIRFKLIPTLTGPTTPGNE